MSYGKYFQSDCDFRGDEMDFGCFPMPSSTNAIARNPAVDIVDKNPNWEDLLDSKVPDKAWDR